MIPTIVIIVLMIASFVLCQNGRLILIHILVMIYFPLKSKYSSIVLISTVFLYILKLHTFIQHFMENLKSDVPFIFSEVSAWEVFYKHMNIICYSIWFCFNYVNLFAGMTNFLSTLMYVKWKGRRISLPGQNFDLVFDQLAIYFYCMFWMLWYGIKKLQLFLYCHFCEV